LLSQNACAKEVFIQIGNGISSLAEYSEGDNDKPAVLVLHGMLQTKEFSTIRLIGDHLEDAGYSTLRPTLSLGLDSRKQSLACEAIHTHSMATDITEIAKWVDWLQKKTGKPVILVGHSAGATQLVAYLDKNREKNTSFQKIILISLAYFSNRPNSKTDSESINRAKQAVSDNKKGPDQYKFTYCSKYISLPEAYLSYIEWNQNKVTESLKEIKTPVSLLFGAGDKRIDQLWPPQLLQMGMDVTIIEGANHFFHDDHEFDLLDYMDDVLQN
jgi:dienelactone hydrolase